MTQSRRWLTPLRALVLAVAGLAGAALIIANHRTSMRRFLEQFESVLPLGTALSADVLGDWVAMRAAQATMLARLAADGGLPREGTRASRDALMALVVAEGGFHSGRVLVSSTPLPPLTARALNDSVTVIDFNAPITRSGQATEWVVLTTVANEAAFSHFNVADASDRTQRTSLLMISGDSVIALASSLPGGVARPAVSGRSIQKGMLLTDSYRAAVRVAGAAPSYGSGAGLYGSRVVFARTPVPGSPLLLVRERDLDELAGLLGARLWVTDAIFALLTLLILGVAAALWRAAFLRRENESVQLRSAFVSSVSHELRTPLTQIRMYAEMLRLGLLDSPPDSARALGVIEKEAERLSMLVERALSMTRSGVVPPPDVIPLVDVAAAVRTAVTTVSPLAVERRNTVVVDIPDGVAARIEPDALHQILLNLLDNAIKYGAIGQRIRVGGTTEGMLTRVVVEDQGPGVPREERDTVWRPFARGRAAEAGAQIGSGIGLAVVRDLATRAGGRAFVESAGQAASEPGANGGGARFVVELPSGVTT